LNFSQEQVVFFIGHSLRNLYDDVLAADMPDYLKTLVLKLEETYPP
jgi:integration host factor subunit alpha